MQWFTYWHNKYGIGLVIQTIWIWVCVRQCCTTTLRI